MGLAREIEQLGGLAPAYKLISRGWTYRALSRAVAEGTVVRIRQGWYALPRLDAELASAWRVGGLLTCVSGARTFGMWTPSDDRLHVAIPRKHARARHHDDMRVRLCDEPDPHTRVHWGAHDACDSFRATPLSCVLDMARCHPPAVVMAAIDSGLRTQAFSHDDIAILRRILPGPYRRAAQWCDPLSESFPESVLRFRLRDAGINVQVQSQIENVRVDFLIGTRLVIEVDGREFHGTHDGFERDRVRDAELSTLGYRCLRFTYRQVVYTPDVVIQAVRSAIARGDHTR